MRYCTFFAIVLLMKLVAGNEADAITGPVVKLDGDNFSTELSKSHHFVMFFAPWCGHCERLKPTWAELASTVQSNPDEKVVIAEVDCTTATSLCSQQDVTGYPTLKFFSKGVAESQRHRGPRDLGSLLSFIKETLGLPDNKEKVVETNTEPLKGAVELSEDNFHDHVASGEHFVKFFAPWCGHCQKMAGTWDSLAQSVGQDNSVTIGKVDCTQYRNLCNEFEVKGYPTLLWIKDGKKVEKYQGTRTHEDLKAFIERMKGGDGEAAEAKTEKATVATSSPVVQLVDSNFENGIASGVTFVKFYAPWCGHCKRMSPTWDELATKFVGKTGVKIAKVDCTDGSNRQLCADQKVNGFPTMFLYSNGAKVEEYDGNRSLDDMFFFVAKLLNEKQEKDEL
uniref:Thioredoxin domain-containing protein n=1 Tax=Daphnia magna TaxID=35525 RepID=A0A0P5TR08_9CRUS